MSGSDWCTCHLHCLFTSTPFSNIPDIADRKVLSDELAPIVEIIRQTLSPEQVILFGTMAAERCGENDLRMFGFCTAHAAEMLLHALHGAFHAYDTPRHTLPELFLRVRTLSAELFAQLDPEQQGNSRLLLRLEKLRRSGCPDPSGNPTSAQAECYSERIASLHLLTERVCRQRLASLRQRAEA